MRAWGGRGLRRYLGAQFPECILRTPSGATSLDFSRLHPNVLAVGFYDGTVAMYDVR